MKKTFLGMLATLMMMPMILFSQTYENLWKQVAQAETDDLPQTQQKILRQIVKKAERERAYGQLLKASLMQVRVQAAVSPDSLQDAVERLRQQAEATTDVPLQAVCYAVLGKVYEKNTHLSDDWRNLCQGYFQKAMEHPAELAAVRADGYRPFVVKGSDSQLYGDDLLSLIGHETRQYRPMYDYYMTTGNRRAQLMSRLYMLTEEDNHEGIVSYAGCDYIGRLDSLANAYGDLTECGEVAVTRYVFMSEQTDATAEQKVAYIDEALSRWGGWHRMNILRNARRDLTARQFNALLEHRVWIPNREQQLTLNTLRGIDQLTIKIYKVKADGDIELEPWKTEGYKKLKPLLTLLPERTLTRTYSGKKDYELYGERLQLEGLPVGVYMMEVESQPQTSVSRTLFFVSDVRVLAEALPGNQMRYVAVNATTGKPVGGAKIRLCERYGYGKCRELATLTTDDKGECTYTYQDDEQPNKVFVTTAADRACPEMYGFGRYRYPDFQRDGEHVAVYTDRSIYRPGQTVHVAAICYHTTNGYEHEAMGGKQVRVSLRDANRQTVAERLLTADELGTVSTSFTLPASGLTGEYSVLVDNQWHWFSVEEYKRPTFQVEFPKVEQDYKDGDTLTVRATARTYAGVPVQGARVTYTVERRLAFWWISYYRYWQGGYAGNAERNEEVFSGEATTSDDGTFEVQIPMVLPKSLHPLFYNFVVEADVTDQAGETHQGQLSLPLGNRKTALTTDLPEKVLTEQAKPMRLHLLNAAGNDIDAEVDYQLDGGKWLKARTNTNIGLPRLKSGEHTLLAVCGEDSLERKFVVFSLDDKRPATETDNWFYVSDDQFPNDGRPVTLQVGSSKDVHIVYTIVAGNDIIEQGAIDRKNELENRKLTYKPAYGNGLTLSYAWVRDGMTYCHSIQIQRPLPDKQLRLRWETFRDRLKPGEQEEWTLKIEMPDGTPCREATGLMATLIDKSLDQLTKRKHVWSLEPSTWLPMASLRWIWGEWGYADCTGYKREEMLKVRELSLSRFDQECFPYPWVGRRPRLLMSRSGSMKMMAADEMEEAAMPIPEVAMGAQTAIGAFDVAGNDEETDDALNRPIAGLNIKAKETTMSEVQMRGNLQETAFFYPQLAADSTGRVSIRFTLPESLTTWRFMGIAHTRDMMYGYIDGETVAQKEVMIQPNVPRFLRVGDEATISARIFNMTDGEQHGTAQLQLIDPESEQVVYAEQAACLLPANGTSTASFRVDASKLESYSLLICKVGVSSADFSDGEQHYLPILPNRERVTVTVPFTQHGPGTKAIDLTKLLPSGHDTSRPYTSGKLTIEYTNSPVWLMVQALPTMGNPCDKNAISQAASLYANGVGKYILDQQPQARHLFEMWKRENASPSSLLSPLEKNQELKDVVLSETPWVMDADRETEQKQRLADFFDENLIQQRLASAIAQLEKLQLADGSWSWWEGMNGSFYMTVEVSEMLVRLKQMAGEKCLDSSKHSALNAQLNQAFQYMNKEILELVAEMKRQEKKGVKQSFPTFKALQYLYLCTLDGREQPASVQQAHDYLKKLLKKDAKKQTIYEKALSAIVLNDPLYVKSLKEWTVYAEEMGRYYDTPRAGYSWRDYRIPTQVAAIECLQRLSPDDTQTIDEMRRWLLQEKRTQAWDTPINSVDAVYAFMSGMGPVSAMAPTSLKLDGQPIETSQATAGIGYVKVSQSYSGERTFTAEKTSDGTSWGAVYAQSVQHTADIADQKSGISVKRELVGADGGRDTSRPYKVGQRVKVRLTIEADRDYDFVEVVDKRAACMEPVSQLSGYHWGYYCAPKDNATCYYFDLLPKGKHVIETEYYIDRPGRYETGTCTVQCAYAPEFRGITKSMTLKIED